MQKHPCFLNFYFFTIWTCCKPPCILVGFHGDKPTHSNDYCEVEEKNYFFPHWMCFTLPLWLTSCLTHDIFTENPNKIDLGSIPYRTETQIKMWRSTFCHYRRWGFFPCARIIIHAYSTSYLFLFTVVLRYIFHFLRSMFVPVTCPVFHWQALHLF